METALTFGSLGDIISIWQLAIHLRRALGRGCDAASGSSNEYQELRRDLDLFVRILMQVVSTYEQRENSVYLSELDRITKSVVAECATLIDGALQKFRGKYHESLQAQGSGGRLRDGYKKIEWAFREKERLQNLREKLQRNTERLSLLVGLTARKSGRVDNITLLARIVEIQRLVSAEAESKEEILRLLKEQTESTTKQAQTLNAVNEQLAATSGRVWEVLTSVTKTLAIVVEVQNTLTHIAQVVVNSQVLASNSIFLRYIDPTRELPVTIEDSLGKLHTIPPGWIEKLQWKTLHYLLEDQFRDRKGYEIVRQRQYALEEDCTGKDIDRQVPISQSLRRGMKVNMSMVFKLDLLSGVCPRCDTDNQAPEDLTIQCKKQGCGMRFRLTEARSIEAPAVPAVDASSVPSKSSTEDLPARRSVKENAKRRVIPAGPSDFMSVRILRTIKHTPMREPRANGAAFSDFMFEAVIQNLKYPEIEVITDILVSDKYSDSLVTGEFTDRLGLPAEALSVSEMKHIKSPGGLLRPTDTVVIYFRVESLGTPYYPVKVLVCDEDDLRAGPVIFGQDVIPRLRRSDGSKFI